MIRNNVQLKYALKRKVSEPAQKPVKNTPELHPILRFFCMCEQSNEDDEAFKLLQLSKDEQTGSQGDQEDEELIVAEYESDDESKNRSR